MVRKVITFPDGTQLGSSDDSASYRIAIIKYDASNGSILWKTLMPKSYYDNGVISQGLLIKNNGDIIYAARENWDGSNPHQVRIFEIDPTNGTYNENGDHSIPWGGSYSGIRTDENGNFYLFGRKSNEVYYSSGFTKYDSNFNEIWDVQLESTSNNDIYI